MQLKKFIHHFSNRGFPTSMNLQYLELFGFSHVLALPKISNIVLDINTFFLIFSIDSALLHKYSIKYFAVSVLPAPDIPVMTIVCDRFDVWIFASASDATKYNIHSRQSQKIWNSNTSMWIFLTYCVHMWWHFT